MSRARSYCYTLNNYTPLEYVVLRNVECKYHIIGKEVGTEGTPHLQGFVMFKEGTSFLKAKKVLGDRCHIEVCKGSPISNFEYCSKGKDFIEMGDRPKGKGKRTDLDNVAEAIKGGATKREICDNYGSQFIKYHNGIEKMISVYQEHRSKAPVVIWYYGETGCGKTRLAVKTGNLKGSYYIKDNTKWWNGYEQQKVIIVDDFDHEENGLGFRNLIKLLDRYEFLGESKGSYVKINSELIIVTSDRSPVLMFDEKKYSQLKRRITLLKELKNERDEVFEEVLHFDQLNELF